MLVLGGCGAGVLAASTTTADGTPVGTGHLGVALAFGLTVLVMAYAVGPVSGAHVHPAVTVGLAVAGRFRWREVPGCVAAQLVGAVLAAAVLFAVTSGRAGFDASASGSATNGDGTRFPGGYSVGAAFVVVILGATDTRAPDGSAPAAIGPALFAGGAAIGQLWLFVLAPLLGAVLGAVVRTAASGRVRDTSSLQATARG